jgi:hypothetical protein
MAEPPPTPSVQEAQQGLDQYLDVGEVVTAVVVGGVERGGVHVAVSNRGIWLAGPTWRPIHRVPNHELTGIERVEGGLVVEAGADRLPVRVWDEAAADRFVSSAHQWLEAWEDS